MTALFSILFNLPAPEEQVSGDRGAYEPGQPHQKTPGNELRPHGARRRPRAAQHKSRAAGELLKLPGDRQLIKRAELRHHASHQPSTGPGKENSSIAPNPKSVLLRKANAKRFSMPSIPSHSAGKARFSPGRGVPPAIRSPHVRRSVKKTARLLYKPPAPAQW